MLSNERRSPSFIIGSRHAGRWYLTSRKGYSSVLQKNVVGEMSDAHRQALKVVFDCCDIPMESWNTLSELIEQHNDEKVMEILSQVDETGQSCLERDFISKSLTSMEIARNASSTILEQAEQLTEEQRFYVEIIHKNAKVKLRSGRKSLSIFHETHICHDLYGKSQRGKVICEGKSHLIKCAQHSVRWTGRYAPRF